ncbi:7003_t:CDS:10 [Ambispora gerdemannii]|uniref:Palmitoyltransferase n=1 Tax=Ambispora gerdemannii TaxID=144530 RepID=A0A9N8ZZ27_9GLOM|nr:7003_t:CDS:10 [Ambispora gerdemannii]
MGPSNRFRHGPIGKLHKFLAVTLLGWILNASKCFCGNRLSRKLDGVYRYFMEEKNPILQLVYLTLLTASIYIFKITGWEEIPGPYLSRVHLILVPLVILFTYLSLFIASWSDPGRITRENAIKAGRMFEYDLLLFEPHNVCRTCLIEKPARSKHCSLCAWINNCVGLRNHRFFIMFLYATTQICFYGTYIIVWIFFGIAKEKNLSAAYIYNNATGKRVPITFYQTVLYLIHQERLLGSLGVFAFLDLEDIILSGELYCCEKELIVRDDDNNNGKNKMAKKRKSIMIYWSETAEKRKDRLARKESPAGSQVRSLQEVRNIYDAGFIGNFKQLTYKRSTLTGIIRTAEVKQSQSMGPTSLDMILEFARGLGYTEVSSAPTSQTASSLKLMDLLDELMALQDKINGLQKDITKIKDLRETCDIVNSSELEKKIKILETLSNHIQSILSNKQVLVMRFKNPHVGEHINIEPKYHKELAELFPTIIQSIASLPKDMENAKWFDENQQIIIDEEKLSKQLSSTASIIAMYGNYADCLDRIRMIVKEMQEKFK